MKTIVKSQLPVLALEIDEEGTVAQKSMQMTRQGQLDNTLLDALYPGIRVASVAIPGIDLDDYGRAKVEQALAQFRVGGVEYRLIGASGSAKNGKYYAVNKEFEKPIAERFQQWPEAAITYFGILISPCQVRLEEPDIRVLVVEDHVLGTNDCRGWIQRSLFEKLGLPARHFYQFRLAFARTQAKGSFKVMENDAAEQIGANIILPKSSLKPASPEKSALVKLFSSDAQMYRGPVVLGIREISRELEYESSYTLLTHAPEETIDLEVLPQALEQVRKLKTTVDENNFEELFRLLGTSNTSRPVHGDEVGSEDGEYTSAERTVVEAALKADGSGQLIKFPFINNQLQRILCRWAYKLCTAGGFRLPAFALADDGYLVAHNGRIYSGSDWMTEGYAITSLDSSRLLEVRYPIRAKDDLLPLRSLTAPETARRLMDDLTRQGCSMSETDAAQQIISSQLHLQHTITIHSKTAAKNGGDYDFDVVCVVEERRFPRWVEDRFHHRETFSNEKDKRKKARSAWWNLPQVAVSAKGNGIGVITDLMTSCLAEGRPDLAEILAKELQAALDQLKHGTMPNQDVIIGVRKQVTTAPWLRLKDEKRAGNLPLHLTVSPTDTIGRLYNVLRKEIDDFFSDVRPLGDFRGLIVNGRFDREMYKEAGQIATVYGVNISLIMKKREKYQQELNDAQAEVNACDMEDAAARRKAFKRRNTAKAALHWYDERSRQEMRNMIHLVRKWAERKSKNAYDWLAALYAITCKGSKSTGSIVFYAFPQELVNMIAERTGGRPVTVAIPDLVDGDVYIDEDGNVYLIDQIDDGQGQIIERETFLMQVTRQGDLIYDHGRAQRIFPVEFESGRVEVRDGKLELPSSKQKPKVPKPKLDDE
ncbi:MAG: hypothetical protein K2X03_02515 [Bryobacteraceae bacterium]|nr:hypothetical protein [Bryobacteraceae bacterium]